MNFTKEQYEHISRIFYPKDNFVVPFNSRWEHTRENVGKHIVEDDFPVSFKLDKYFELHNYLISQDIIKTQEL